MNAEKNILQEDSGFRLESERVGERIKDIRGKKNRDNFALQMGVSKSTLARYENGERTPDAEFLLKLHYLYKASPLWILSGQGARLRSQESMRDLIGQTESKERSEVVDVPILDVEVSAGHGTEPGREEPSGSLCFQRSYLDGRGLAARDLLVVYAKGDSMEPEIQDGAAMLVNTSDARLDEGCIYIIRLNAHLFAKRVQRDIDGSVRLISSNSLYSPVVVQSEQLQDMQVLGRVVWSGREH